MFKKKLSRKVILRQKAASNENLTIKDTPVYDRLCRSTDDANLVRKETGEDKSAPTPGRM